MSIYHKSLLFREVIRLLKSKKLLMGGLALIIFLIILPLNIVHGEENDFEAEVQANYLNVRSGPSTTYSILGEVKYKQIVTVVDNKGDWATIDYDGNKGYVHNGYIKSLQPSFKSQWMTPNVAALNVRQGPSLDEKVLGTLKTGDKVFITSVDDGWGSFSEDGNTKYTYFSYLEASSKPDELIDIAKKEKSGEITATKLNIRKQPTTDSEIVGKYSEGDKVNFKKYNDTWGEVINDGSKAYIHLSYVEEIEEEQQETVVPEEPIHTKGLITATVLNVREGPSSETRVLGQFKNQDEVILLSKSGDWYEVIFEGETSYIHGNYVDVIQSDDSKDIIEDTPEVTLAYVTATLLNVREEPTTSSDVVGQLKKSEEVGVIKIESGWARIEYGDKEAFISADYISSDQIEETESVNWKYIVTSYGLNVRTSPSSSSEIVGLVSRGDELQVISYLDDWTKISFEGRTAYVSSRYIEKIEQGVVTNSILEGKKIIIDAGHGGYDRGAGANGLVEKTINLDVAKRVKKNLEDMGADIILTRDTDEFISLSKRTDISNSSSADIFVSIHANSSSTSLAHGIETFYYPNSADQREIDSKNLSQLIQMALLEETHLSNRGTKGANFQVIKYNTLPSTLVEIGFLTNPYEANRLSQSSFRGNLAKGISDGIKEYFTK